MFSLVNLWYVRGPRFVERSTKRERVEMITRDIYYPNVGEFLIFVLLSWILRDRIDKIDEIVDTRYLITYFTRRFFDSIFHSTRLRVREFWTGDFTRQWETQWNGWLGDFIEPLRVRESLTRRVLWKRCRCTHDEFIRRDILILVLDQIIKTFRPSASCLLDHNIFVSRAPSNVWYHRLNYSKRVRISLYPSLKDVPSIFHILSHA